MAGKSPQRRAGFSPDLVDVVDFHVENSMPLTPTVPTTTAVASASGTASPSPCSAAAATAAVAASPSSASSAAAAAAVAVAVAEVATAAVSNRGFDIDSISIDDALASVDRCRTTVCARNSSKASSKIDYATATTTADATAAASRTFGGSSTVASHSVAAGNIVSLDGDDDDDDDEGGSCVAGNSSEETERELYFTTTRDPTGPTSTLGTEDEEEQPMTTPSWRPDMQDLSCCQAYNSSSSKGAAKNDDSDCQQHPSHRGTGSGSSKDMNNDSGATADTDGQGRTDFHVDLDMELEQSRDDDESSNNNDNDNDNDNDDGEPDLCRDTTTGSLYLPRVTPTLVGKKSGLPDDMTPRRRLLFERNPTLLEDLSSAASVMPVPSPPNTPRRPSQSRSEGKADTGGFLVTTSPSSVASRPNSAPAGTGRGLKSGLPSSLAWAARAAGFSSSVKSQEATGAEEVHLNLSNSTGATAARRIFAIRVPTMDSLLSTTSSARRILQFQSTPEASQPNSDQTVSAGTNCTAAIGRWNPVQGFLAERVRDGSAGLPPNIIDLIDFKGCTQLLRASRLSTILNRRGRIFKASTGSAKTYSLSEPVDRIDHFVSHNWCIPRHKKFLSLALHFNFNFAALVTLLLGVCLGIATSAGWAPMIDSEAFEAPKGVVCRIVLIPTFLFMLFFSSDIRSLFGYNGPSVFLDKTCIHQEDTEIQRQGIEKLGAFLCHSERMVILYTDWYLRKLWTVYEVASFLALHPLEQVTVIPFAVPCVILTGLVCSWVAIVASIPLEIMKEFYYGPLLTSFLLAPLLGRALRGLRRSRDHIGTRLDNFKVKDCLCLNEDDRPLVYRNIAALMIETQRLPRDFSMWAALRHFEGLVGTELRGALRASAGEAALEYKYLLCLSCSSAWPMWLDSLLDWHQGTRNQHFLHLTLWYATVMISIYPLILSIFGGACGQHLEWRGWKEWAWMILMSTLIYIPIWGLAFVADQAQIWSTESAACTAFFVFLFVASSAITAYLVRGCRKRRPSLGPNTRSGSLDPSDYMSSAYTHHTGVSSSIDSSMTGVTAWTLDYN